MGGIDLSMSSVEVTWVAVFEEGNTKAMYWDLNKSAQKITIPSWTNETQVYSVVEKKGDVLTLENINIP